MMFPCGIVTNGNCCAQIEIPPKTKLYQDSNPSSVPVSVES